MFCFIFFFLLHKSINLTTEPGSIHYSLYIAITRGKMGLIEIMSAHTHTHATDTHKHLTRTLQISLSRLWREQTHRWNFKHSLYFSSSDMLRKKEEKNPTKNKYQLRLQSVQLSSPVYKTNQPVLLAPRSSHFFISEMLSPHSEAKTWKENAEQLKRWLRLRNLCRSRSL